MIDYAAFTLDNGLRVLVHEDHTAPLAVLNLIYDVGSRDEHPDKTGFAHLFEHLMFGGSRHIPSYDTPLQRVGGENNAFTSPDVTNYHISLPSANLETAFWLESDRMLSLDFSPRALEVQRKVVIEEFNQRYLNQPYGDTWLLLRPLAYRVHPYRWPTIGKEISHIADATLDDVADFFHHHYLPNNAVLVVAGDVTEPQVRQLAEKWFGPIAAGAVSPRQLPAEPPQTEKRTLAHRADVPQEVIFKAFHMGGRTDDDYYACDLLSDVLGRAKTSRLHRRLVKERGLFTSVQAFVTGSTDPGLLVVRGKLSPGVSMATAEQAIDEVLAGVREDQIQEEELARAKNQAESSLIFSEVGLLNRAMNLAGSALLGDANLINREPDLIRAVTTEAVRAAAQRVLRDENSSVLYYHKNR